MIDRDVIESFITEEDVVNVLVNELGSSPPTRDRQGNLIFDCVCHCGNKKKLYYYPQSKSFQCYTNCGTMSIFDLLMVSKNMRFEQTADFWCKLKGKNYYDNDKRHRGLTTNIHCKEELEFLRLHNYKPTKTELRELPSYRDGILTNGFFDNCVPNTWVEDEGISEEVLVRFEVDFWCGQLKGIIPHRDIYGHLVGIKARNFLQEEVEAGRKYIPITIGDLTYRYPMNMNLYGIYQNKENIKRLKKCIIFESEKSVWKYATYKGQENNIALASCGLNISLYQRNLLLSLGVEEVTIAFDKQYEIDKICELTKDELDGSKEYQEFLRFMNKVKRDISLFINRVQVTVIFDWEEDGKYLNYKDAPIDNGEEVFDVLYQNRFVINSLEDFDEFL